MSFYRTEQCFRRYELAITEALIRWPNSIRFKTERALNTDAARCRDAISAFRENSWEPSRHPELFAKLKAGEIKPRVWVADDHVVIGHRALRTPSAQPEQPEIAYDTLADSMGAITLRPTNNSHIDAILLLVEHSVTDFPIAIEFRWHDTVVEKCSDLLNVAIKPDEAANKLYIF